MKVKAWVEAMRLRTLPVSVAGVFCAVGYAVYNCNLQLLPASLCFIFAVLAQIASNFANEYYDFKGGLDKVGRDGPRRGVTEGDITPNAMKTATFAVLGIACLVGCSLIYWGGLWLVPVGIMIALGVLAYSTGPYPLSHHCLGELAVVFFFGLIPVNMTYFLTSGGWSADVFSGSVAMGLMGANVLIVNNYRDADDDRAVGKHTIAVKFGKRVASIMYLLNGLIAVALMLPIWLEMGAVSLVIPVLYLGMHCSLFAALNHRSGATLNPLLGLTAMAMLYYAVAFVMAALIVTNY